MSAASSASTPSRFPPSGLPSTMPSSAATPASLAPLESPGWSSTARNEGVGSRESGVGRTLPSPTPETRSPTPNVSHFPHSQFLHRRPHRPREEHARGSAAGIHWHRGQARNAGTALGRHGLGARAGHYDQGPRGRDEIHARGRGL